MTYIKKTQVSGYTSAGVHVFYRLSGHWDSQKVLNKVRKVGVVSEVSINYITIDTSGKRRGGIDAHFKFDSKDVLQPTTK